MTKRKLNVQTLRDDLLNNYELVKANEMDIQTSKELSNTAGKVFMSAKVQMEYNKLSGQPSKKIQFMESGH